MDPTLLNPNRAMQENVQPIAQAPVSPAPQINTPATPLAQPSSPVTVNVGTPTKTAPEAPQTPQNASGQAQTALTMPPTGSVVDLLNMAGQDSSFANRQNLAKQYGIQAYSGTAQQNQDLSKKYLEAFNANKGTKVPDTGAQASSALDTYFKESPTQTNEDPQANFYDAYSNLNPVTKALYDGISQILSTPNTKQTFKEEYDKLLAEQGVPALRTELMNIKRIMDGTDDDIRTEISKAGGFATESQVQAMTASRNKVLLKQATSLSDQLQMKDDYVDQIMQFSKLDREQVEKDVDRKLGLTEKLIGIQEKMDTATKNNYQKIVDTVGYSGLAQALQGDKLMQSYAEKTMGLPKGALSNTGWLAVNGQSTKNQPDSIQEYEYAKEQGFKGSYIDYQNQDANRKKSIAAAGVGGLTNSQINSTVNGIAGAFDNEPLVKEYNTAKTALNALKAIGTKTQSPTDDMAFIYGFAKIMDPNSAVKEGEYDTVQDYAQALTQRTGLKLKRITDNSNFLTEDAKTKMLATLESKVGSLKNGYDIVSSEYQRQIDDAYTGKPRQITNYSGNIPQTPPSVKIGNQSVQVGAIITNKQGKRARVNADGTVTPI